MVKPKKKLNGVHMELSLEPLAPVKKKRGRPLNSSAHQRALLALRRACTSSDRFRTGTMTAREFVPLMEAALKDAFEPLPKDAIRQWGDYLARSVDKATGVVNEGVSLRNSK
jgi:hypothetical protein